MKTPEVQFHSAQEYWDTAANTYDLDFTTTVIGQSRRAAVWRKCTNVFFPGQTILELNCGTGFDAVYFAKRGIRVVACDISPRMIEIARERADAARVASRIDFRVIPTEQIQVLIDDGPFDGAFSNFAGLNCVEDLSAVVQKLARLLRPGARVLVSMMGRIVPWEIAWFLAHGRVRKAFRRLTGGNRGLSWGPLTIHQPSVRSITRTFAEGFSRRDWKGIGIAVMPTYMEVWGRRFPKVIQSLAGVDDWIGGFPLFRGLADCVLLEFERERSESVDYANR